MSDVGIEAPARKQLQPNRQSAADAPKVPFETYAALLNQRVLLRSQNPEYVGVERYFLATILVSQVKKIHFDATWYLRKYPDIAEAIDRGECLDAHQHYLFHGFYEHRMPYAISVEEAWYLEQYSDVAAAVRNADYLNGQTHFEELGYKEGRVPFPHFALLPSREA
jgi:hypothetical protein